MKKSKIYIGLFITLFAIAMAYYLSNYPSNPDLIWKNENGYRWAELSIGHFGSSGFRMLNPEDTGIDFENIVSDQLVAINRYYLNGSGVAAGDIDGNGLVDLYFTRLDGPNRLYRNLGGMQFEDITNQANVAHKGISSSGAVFADINGNGHLDLLVTAIEGENVLYINSGDGTFYKELDSGLGSAHGGMSMTLADITGNGYLDLYITNYKERSAKDLFTAEELQWENILNEPLINPTDNYTLKNPYNEHYKLRYHEGRLVGNQEIGQTDEFYFNSGGKFSKADNTKDIFLDEEGKPFGLQPNWGLSAKFQDLNNDGLQDLYVCNDFHTPDRIWINQGNARFQAIPVTSIRNLTFSCMGVDFSDINRDGELDIFTTGMLSPLHSKRLTQADSNDPVPLPIGGIESRPIYNRNSMYIKRSDNTYSEITYLSGTEATGWSWATRFLDVNLDGYEDIIVNTGYPYDVLDIDTQIALGQSGKNMYDHFMDFVSNTPSLELPNRIFRNNMDLTFTEIGRDWGFTVEDVSHGMAIADLNGDGALDLVTNRMNDKAAIFINRSNNPRIAVRLMGDRPNTSATGANVELYGGPVKQIKQVSTGGDYLSGSDQLLMFAADEDNHNHQLSVKWPDGRQSLIENVRANRIYEIDQSSSFPPDDIEREVSVNYVSASIFTDISDKINHMHHETLFEDFEIQPMLPRRLSQSGSGVAWLDLTNSGSSELIIGSGRNGYTSVFTWNGESFDSLKIDGLTNESVPGDQTAVIGWHENDQIRLLAGISNYEQGKPEVASAHDFLLNQNGIIDKDSIPGDFSSTGPISAADVNGDGSIDLFLGGSFKPGRYPENADSRLFLNENGQFKADSSNNNVFEDLGLITGAVFTDITNNGWPDLLLASEWGSLRLFKNISGQFREVTSDYGLDYWNGWWQGVTTGDFTGNGRMDIVASNLGRNSQWKLRSGRELRLYYDDMNVDGLMNLIDSYFDEKIGQYVPRQRLYEFSSLQIPLNRMGSHKEFAEANLEEILGERISRIPYKTINTLDHMIFVNMGNKFEAKPLPVEAQKSAGFHVGVADVNNDGYEDLFLSQNLFSYPRQTPRQDAGRGLLMTGDGNGNFEAVNGEDSGIKIYGEQRGAAFGDFNKDGRIDLAVTQNGAQTRVFRNQIGKQGIRIILEGPRMNQNGIGSKIQLLYNNGSQGPVREIKAGSGYWSQSDFTQIMGANSDIDQIHIQWFDGTLQKIDYNSHQLNYIIRHPFNEIKLDK